MKFIFPDSDRDRKREPPCLSPAFGKKIFPVRNLYKIFFVYEYAGNKQGKGKRKLPIA